MADLTVNLAGLTLKNPVMTASGTFGHGDVYEPFMDVSRLGALVGKSVTLKPRKGNHGPRIWETPSGMLNAIGLENRGIEHFEREIIPHYARYDTAIIANIAGNSPEEYRELAARVSKFGVIKAIEYNLSCPNVHAGGRVICATPEATAEFTRAVRTETDLPIFGKLSPNIGDLPASARAACAAGADGVSLVNTFLALALDWRTKKPRIHNVLGGLSGPAIKPIALRMVWQVATAIDKPVIGIGGISNAEDVLEFMTAGATAVEIGSANFGRPDVTASIIDDLARLLDGEGIPAIADVIGTFAPNS